MAQEIIYKELSYKITGIAFTIHNQNGRFCREKQYAELFETGLKENSIPYSREANLQKINSLSPSGNRADFVINNQIVVDLKAKRIVTKDDYLQMQRYLQATKMRLGIIINFRQTHLCPKRVINYSQY